MAGSGRRVVTGHDAAGKSVVVSDGMPPQDHPLQFFNHVLMYFRITRMAFFHIAAEFSDELLAKLPQPLELME